MSCDYFDYSPRGRQGIGVIQPQSGLDYPFVGFNPTTWQQRLANRLTYPVRAVIVGGTFELCIQAPGNPPPPPTYISDLSPAWPDVEPIETVLPVVNSVNNGANVTGSYVDNINAAIAYYNAQCPLCSVTLNSATIELALIDDNNLVVGWASADSYQTTAVIGTFPAAYGENSFFTKWRAYRRSACADDCSLGFVVNPPWALITDNEFRGLIADFYLAYDDPALYDDALVGVQHPLTIKWLYGFGCEQNPPIAGMPTPTHDADILIVDSNDNVVFDSTNLGPEKTYDQFSVREWGPDYKIYEWVGELGVCRLVTYATWPPDETEPFTYAVNIAPEEDAVLDERAVYRMPRRVLSLSVRAGNQTLGTLAELPSIALLEGYNMEIRAGALSSANQLRNTEISFAAIAGAGAGQYSDCDTTGTPAIRSIGGAAANKYDDLLLASSGCGYIRPKTVNGSPALSVGDDCPPCCDCPDYVNLALYMNRLRERYKLIGDRAHETKQLYDANIERWKAQYDCRTAKPLRLLLVPQSCPYMDIVALFCNHCDPCAKNVRLNITLSTFPASSATIACGYTELVAPNVRTGSAVTLSGSFPTYSVTLPDIEKGQSGYVKFRLGFGLRMPLAVTATLTGTQGSSNAAITAGCDTTIPATVTMIEALNCDNFGNNSQPC